MTVKNYKINLIVVVGWGLTGAILTCTHTHTLLQSTEVPGKVYLVKRLEMILSI